MRSGSKPPSTGSPTSSPGTAMTIPSISAAPKRSGFWPNPLKHCGCCVSIKTTTETDPPNPMILTRSQPKTTSILISLRPMRKLTWPPNLIAAPTPDWLRISRRNRIPPPMRHHTRSLRITPPPFDPNRARPRAVIYVHLSEAALTAGSGVARVEDVGPVLLNRLHMLARPGSGISDPHSRYHHRVKTFGGWQVRQPEPGSWI